MDIKMMMMMVMMMMMMRKFLFMLKAEIWHGGGSGTRSPHKQAVAIWL